MAGYQRATASTVMVFCFDNATAKGKTGEAANITLYYLEAGASPPPTQVTDTTFTEVSSTLADGYYMADLATTEIDTAHTYFFAKCSTANIGAFFVPPQFTMPPSFYALNAPGVPGGLATYDNLFFGVNFTVNDVTPAVGNFDIDGANLSPNTGDHDDQFLFFTSGAAGVIGIGRFISTYTAGAPGNVAFTGSEGAGYAAFPVAPANGDTGIILALR